MQPLKTWLKRNFADMIYGGMRRPASKDRLLIWLNDPLASDRKQLSDWSFNIFTYHGEDGIIGRLLQLMDDVPPVFVDAGAGNCIISNCSTLAVHFGWTGLFIDRDKKQLGTGIRFYRDTKYAGLKFSAEEIRPDTINDIIADNGIAGEIGLLSIDIDGNDYWIWNLIDVVKPRIVVIEAKVEFGLREAIVPEGSFNQHSVDKMYNGASVESLRLLGEKKGYKLAGANKQGYNLFFVKKEETIPAVSTATLLSDPAIVASFYPESFFMEHKFVTF